MEVGFLIGMNAHITRNRNDIILSNTTYDYHLLTFNTWRARTKFVNEQESLIRSYLFG